MKNYSFPKKQIVVFSGCICDVPLSNFNPLLEVGCGNLFSPTYFPKTWNQCTKYFVLKIPVSKSTCHVFSD